MESKGRDKERCKGWDGKRGSSVARIVETLERSERDATVTQFSCRCNYHEQSRVNVSKIESRRCNGSSLVSRARTPFYR